MPAQIVTSTMYSEGSEGLRVLTTRFATRQVMEDTSEERRKLAEAGNTIIATVGDQQSDLDGGFAECPFKVPNPFYFIR